MIVAEVSPLCRVSCITRAASHDDRGQTTDALNNNLNDLLLRWESKRR
jgi:hypothetical protein